MNRNVILVIEDVEDRVGWLKRLVEPMGYWVIWCTSVDDFVREVEARHEAIALLVFDHDLGGARTEQDGLEMVARFDVDANGKTGLDAAREMRSVHGAVALIWSQNPAGARAISDELQFAGPDWKVKGIRRAAFRANEDYVFTVKGALGR